MTKRKSCRAHYSRIAAGSATLSLCNLRIYLLKNSMSTKRTSGTPLAKVAVTRSYSQRVATYAIAYRSALAEYDLH